MRLDQAEKKALRHALDGIRGETFLFGSRVQDDERGGDIDVLVLSHDEPFGLSRRIATRFFMECEERIDVVVMHPTRRTPEQEAFLNTIDLRPLPPELRPQGVSHGQE
jgi:predicted nucleotidyltransferase